MAFGQYDGKDISDPELRKMFDIAMLLSILIGINLD